MQAVPGAPPTTPLPRDAALGDALRCLVLSLETSRSMLAREKVSCAVGTKSALRPCLQQWRAIIRLQHVEQAYMCNRCLNITSEYAQMPAIPHASITTKGTPQCSLSSRTSDRIMAPRINLSILVYFCCTVTHCHADPATTMCMSPSAVAPSLGRGDRHTAMP